MPGDGQSDSCREDERGEWADDGDDLEDARRDRDQEPVRLADRAQDDRGEDAHEGDQDQLSADEGAELLVDQRPGVAQLLAFRSRQHARDQVDRPVTFEDPVGADREREQDSDQHLDRLGADRQSGLYELIGGREMVQAPGELVQDSRLEPSVGGLLARLGGVQCGLHLIRHRRHDERQEERDEPEEREIVEQHAERPRYA